MRAQYLTPPRFFVWKFFLGLLKEVSLFEVKYICQTRKENNFRWEIGFGKLYRKKEWGVFIVLRLDCPPVRNIGNNIIYFLPLRSFLLYRFDFVYQPNVQSLWRHSSNSFLGLRFYLFIKSFSVFEVLYFLFFYEVSSIQCNFYCLIGS